MSILPIGDVTIRITRDYWNLRRLLGTSLPARLVDTAPTSTTKRSLIWDFPANKIIASEGSNELFEFVRSVEGGHCDIALQFTREGICPVRCFIGDDAYPRGPVDPLSLYQE